MDFLTWGQITVLVSILFSIITSTGYLTRIIDRKLNTADYEIRHAELRNQVNKHEIRLSLLEERYNNIKRVLERNGIREIKESH